ncbi:hypothetical protein [Lentzea sp.]|uniref:hypothetical protein n=1 Tax=Lentzea sp. TaxID=56099 RepID=UPI002CB3C6A4|nr:hypothetical protein [Lentzea sp.]HUQ56491.1 hypothetical protein [Lentzea sp.]
MYDEDEERSSLVLIDMRTGELETVKKIDGKVDHVLINPVRGDRLLYHLLDEDRIGLVTIDTKKKTMLTDSNDHGAHPFWVSNGRDAAFAQRAQGETPEQVVTYNIRKVEFFSYDIRERSKHFAMNPAQTIHPGRRARRLGAAHHPFIRGARGPGNDLVARNSPRRHRTEVARQSRRRGMGPQNADG